MPLLTRFPLSCALLLLSFCFLSCEDADSIGIELEDQTVGVQFTDTVTVKVSTVLLDSLVSSGTGTVLAGKYTDQAVGVTSSNAYFQVSLDANWSVDEEAIFDSVRLILPYTGYHYGDTTSTLTLQVQQLGADVTTRSLSPLVGTEEAYSYFYSTAGLYNTSTTPVLSPVLASYSFKPRPKTTSDTISIPLQDALGRSWLKGKIGGDDMMTSASSFLNYFKGLKLTATGQSNVVLGFAASGVKIRLYYREPTEDQAVDSYHDFPLVTGSTQYNQMTSEFSSSALKGIVRGGDPISSEKLNNTGYLQAGTGLMLKLEFPYLTSLKEVTNVELINQALLEIVPLENSNLYPTVGPDSLMLYQSDVRDVPLSVLIQDYSTSQQVAAYKKDEEYNQSSHYQFKVTEYITDLIKNGTYQKSMLVGAPASTFIKTVNRLSVGGPGNTSSRVKLKIYYTRLTQ